MSKLLLLFLLPLSLLQASKILSYNIYDRTDRADVMITFDTPYEGVIKQSISKSKIIIKLEGATIESSKVKKVASKFLHSITLTPLKNQTHIVANVGEGTKLVASKTADGYGLRLRFVDKNLIRHNKTTKHKASTSNSFSGLPTKKGNDMSTSYYIVVSILIIGLFILFGLRKRMIANGLKPKEGTPWLFQENTNSSTQVPKPQVKQQAQQELPNNINPISIRFQKSINDSTSVVMLDFGEQAYLVLLGKSNILLDKFSENKPSTQEDFESILKSRHQELDEFLQVEEKVQPTQHTSFTSSQEALQAYKERAGAISYNDA